MLPFVYWDLVNGNIVRATIVAFVFGMTDWFDGYLARRLDQVSNLGKILDPISDRAFFVVIGIGMVVGDVVSVWPIAIMLARDLLVSIAGLVLLARGGRPPEVTRLGKAATFGLMWAMGFWLLASAIGDVGDPNRALVVVAWITWSINIVLSYASAVDYARTLARSAPDDEHPPSGGPLPAVGPAPDDEQPAAGGPGGSVD